MFIRHMFDTLEKGFTMDKHKRKQLEIEVAKFPVGCCMPIFFADTANQNDQGHSGTMTLMQSSEGIIGVTCWHVVEEFNKLLQEHPSQKIQVGNCNIDLSKHL